MQSSTLKHWYWTITGALIGFGFLGMLTIGWPFLLVGLGMLVGGLVFWRAKGFWIFLLVLGTVPALILLWDIVTAPPPCSPNGPVSVPPGATGYECGGHLEGYSLLAAIFGGIALLGAGWVLLRWLWMKRPGQQRTPQAQKTSLTQHLHETPARFIEGITGGAAGIVGVLMLGVDVFSPIYPPFLGQQCSSGTAGTSCTPLREPVDLIQWGPSPLIVVVLSMVLVAALGVAVSSVLHASDGTARWQRALWIAAAVLAVSTVLSIGSIGIAGISLLTSVVLAVVAVIASYTALPTRCILG